MPSKRGKSALASKPMTKAELAKSASRARRGDGASNPLRRHDYDLHRERVNTAKPMVDTSSPIVVRNTYTSPANFNRSIKNFVNIERENARMLGRIAQIMKEPATVDNRLGFSIDKMNARNHYREKDLLKIAFENTGMYNRIKSAKPVYSREKQLKDYAEAEKVMELTSYFPLFWKVNPSSPHEDYKSIAMANAKSNPRPTVFLELETAEESLGKIVIELRADVVPMTAENFRCLCTGEMGLSYKCSEITRIVPDILWQGGDVTGKDGRGGKSIYGDSFPDENFKLKHDKPGVVTMCNCGPDTGGSQFMILAKKLSALDGVNVVVGKVTSGLDILESLNDLVSSSGALKTKVWITKCGSTDGGNQNEEGAGDNQMQNNYEDEDPEKEDTAPQSAIENTPGSAIKEPSDWKDDTVESTTRPGDEAPTQSSVNNPPDTVKDSSPEIPPETAKDDPPEPVAENPPAPTDPPEADEDEDEDDEE